MAKKKASKTSKQQQDAQYQHYLANRAYYYLRAEDGHSAGGIEETSIWHFHPSGMQEVDALTHFRFMQQSPVVLIEEDDEEEDEADDTEDAGTEDDDTEDAGTGEAVAEAEDEDADSDESPTEFREDEFFRGSEKKVTAAELQQAEERLGVRLPQDYRDFLLNFNGGGLQVPCFQVIGPEASIVLFHVFLGIGTSLDLEQWREEMVDEIPPGYIPIALEYGNNVYLMDTSVEGASPIYYWDALRFLPGDPQQGNTYWLADSFDEFLATLNVVNNASDDDDDDDDDEADEADEND